MSFQYFFFEANFIGSKTLNKDEDALDILCNA